MFRQTKDPNIVMVTGTANCHCGEWRKIRVKKHHWCILTRRFIAAGDFAYRPISDNWTVRKQRMNADAMETFIAYDRNPGLPK